MILDHLTAQSLSGVVVVLLASVLLRLLLNKYGQGLNKIPGPWIAGFSDLWRLFLVRRRHAQEEHIALHQKYGPIVRLGPRAVSIADPDVIKVIYNPSSGYSKVKGDSAYIAVIKGSADRHLVTVLPGPASPCKGQKAGDNVQHG